MCVKKSNHDRYFSIFLWGMLIFEYFDTSFEEKEAKAIYVRAQNRNPNLKTLVCQLKHVRERTASWSMLFDIVAWNVQIP